MNATTPINATPTNRINGMGNSPIVESDGSSFAALTYTWVDHQVNTTTTTFPHSDLSFCLQVVVFLHGALLSSRHAYLSGAFRYNIKGRG